MGKQDKPQRQHWKRHQDESGLMGKTVSQAAARLSVTPQMLQLALRRQAIHLEEGDRLPAEALEAIRGFIHTHLKKVALRKKR